MAHISAKVWRKHWGPTSFWDCFLLQKTRKDYKTLARLRINNCSCIKIHSLFSVSATEVAQLTLKTLSYSKIWSSSQFFGMFFFSFLSIYLSGISTTMLGLSFTKLPTAPGASGSHQKLQATQLIGPHLLLLLVFSSWENWSPSLVQLYTKKKTQTAYPA